MTIGVAKAASISSRILIRQSQSYRRKNRVSFGTNRQSLNNYKQYWTSYPDDSWRGFWWRGIGRIISTDSENELLINAFGAIWCLRHWLPSQQRSSRLSVSQLLGIQGKKKCLESRKKRGEAV